MTLVPWASPKKYIYIFTTPDVKFFNNLIGWMLANAGDATMKKKLSLFQCCLDARDATLAPASYCEPSFK